MRRREGDEVCGFRGLWGEVGRGGEFVLVGNSYS